MSMTGADFTVKLSFSWHFPYVERPPLFVFKILRGSVTYCFERLYRNQPWKVCIVEIHQNFGFATEQVLGFYGPFLVYSHWPSGAEMDDRMG